MAVTKRLIWLDDDDWLLLQGLALRSKVTTSQFVRDYIHLQNAALDLIRSVPQTEKDAILRRINKGGSER